MTRASVGLLAMSVPFPVQAQSSPEQEWSKRETYVLEQICAQCHVRPGIGVPLMGDEAEWGPRRAAGFERLLTNTVEGYLGMPPLGTCSFCTEEELRRLVAILSGMPDDEGR